MNVASNCVIKFGVANHGSKIHLKCKPIFVHPLLQLCSHGAQIHRIFNYVKVTEKDKPFDENCINCILTSAHDPVLGQQVEETWQRVYLLSVF